MFVKKVAVTGNRQSLKNFCEKVQKDVDINFICDIIPSQVT